MALSHSATTTIARATTEDIFDEHDHAKRRKMIEQAWSTNVTVYEPGKTSTGYEGVEKSIDELHSGEQATWKCQIIEPIWVSHNLVHVDWEFGPNGKKEREIGIRGKDILIVGKDGKLDAIYAMIAGPDTVQ